MVRKTILMVLVAALAAPPVFAASTSPGKNSAFESMTGVPLVGLAPPLLTATLLKGKKKTVVKVEAMYTDGPYDPSPTTTRVLGLAVDVNGVLMEPTTGGASSVGQGAVNDCGFATPPPTACTVTGTWWLDIDAAETAHPGMFVNQPLTVTLLGGDLTNGTLVGVQPMDISLSAIVVKK